MLDLKAKVAAERGDEFPAAQQKLIYNGKVLEDAKTLQESGVTESGFVVVMASKVRHRQAVLAGPIHFVSEPRSRLKRTPLLR